MMTSLMSSFDPSSSIFFKNWFFSSLLFMGFTFLFSKFWMVNSTMNFFFLHLEKKVVNLLKKNFFCVIFLIVLFVNIMGLIPMGFSISSHVWPNFWAGLTLWVCSLILVLKENFIDMLIHFTPQGCPLALAPFMVVIEVVSKFIQPLTISLRLTANIMAGHMLINLLQTGAISFVFPFKVSFLLLMIILLVFELGVSIIQAYVFSNLMKLYWEEYKKH